MSSFQVDAAGLRIKRVKIYEHFLKELMSHQNHDDFYVGPSDIAVKNKRRLTQHFITALLSCGVHPESPAILNAYEWLISSKDSPKEDDRANILSLDKIEAAIEMGKSRDTYCEKAIALLQSSKIKGVTTYFDIPNEKADDHFISLRVAKILFCHSENEEFKELIKNILNDFLNPTFNRARENSFLYSISANFWPAGYIKSESGKKLRTICLNLIMRVCMIYTKTIDHK